MIVFYARLTCGKLFFAFSDKIMYSIEHMVKKGSKSPPGRVYAVIDPILLAKAQAAAKKNKWTFTTYLEEALLNSLNK